MAAKDMPPISQLKGRPLGRILIKMGKVTRAQVLEIADTKLPDLNAHDIEAAARIVEGTARSMGIEVVG